MAQGGFSGRTSYAFEVRSTEFEVPFDHVGLARLEAPPFSTFREWLETPLLANLMLDWLVCSTNKTTH